MPANEEVAEPPKDVQEIIEKTAQFVARSGPKFEQRVAAREKDNPKFSFLLQDDPYRPFYERKLAELRGDDAKDKEGMGEVQGEVTGIIYPPPDLRAVVDKTAQFVAKNGTQFERRVMATERGKLKFAFLQPDNPYRAYYDHMVKQFESGAATKPSEPEADAAEEAKAADGKDAAQVEREERLRKATTVSAPAIKSAVAKAAKAAPKHPPPPYEFTAAVPPLTPLEQDVIMLTAQYTAASGRQFLTGLAGREFRNPQFDFLKPTHAYFSYFTALVDQYTRCLKPEPEAVTRLRRGATAKLSVLNRCVHRYEWERAEEAKRKEREAEEEASRVAYQTTNWHEFVVVETIDFSAEDDLSLPAPAAEGALTGTGTGAAAAGGGSSGGGGGMDMDVEMDMDMEDDAPASAPAARPSAAATAAAAMAGGDDEDAIKVRTDYQPQLGVRGTAPRTFIDPRTGRAIPIDQSERHMRIELIDPKWREQTARAAEKQKDSLYAPGDAIAASLQRLARQRTDIFGAEEGAGEQHPAKRQRTETKAVIWDGSTASAEAAAAAAQDPELVAMKRRALEQEQRRREAAQVGPTLGAGAAAAAGAPPAAAAAAGGAMPPPQVPQTPHQTAPPPPPPSVPQPAASAPFPPGQPPMHAAHVPMPPAAPPGYGAPMAAAPGYHAHPYGAVPGAYPGAPHAYPGMQPHMQHPGAAMPHAGGQVPPPPPPAAAPGGAGADAAAAAAAAFAGPDPATGLFPESVWLKDHGGPVSVSVACPEDSSNPDWGLNGQTTSVEVDMAATVRELKDKLSTVLGGMPRGKQQLKHPRLGFLKDALTLAHYNLVPEVPLELSVRTRGGRK